MLEQFQQHVADFSNPELTRDRRIDSFALGLSGESGEVADLLEQRLFFGRSPNISDFRKELGDILFYVVGLAQQFELSVDWTLLTNTRTSSESLIFVRLAQLGLGLAAKSGKAVDYIKKYLYHGEECDRSQLTRYLEEVLWCWMGLCCQLNLSADEVMEANIEKLRQRHEGRRFNSAIAIRNKRKE